MLPNMNPKQMQKIMSQMGIKSEELDAKRAIFELNDGTKLVIDNPNVVQIDMQGQKSFQVSGAVHEEAGNAEGNSGSEGSKSDDEDDASIVAKETGASKEEAQKALDDSNGDIAEAILKLTKE